MRVLVGCEFSGTVRDAFRARGHDAWSCDLLQTTSPGLHYQGDVRLLLDGWMPVRHQCECDPDGDGWCQLADCDPSTCNCVGPTQDEVEYLENEHGLFGRPENAKQWDLGIFHPPCTFLNSAGLHWNTRGRIEGDGRARSEHTKDSLEFVRLLLNAPIRHICLENPVGCISTQIREPDQTIQPYDFGHDASKATCLWLKNLPLLYPTKSIPSRGVGKAARWGNQTDSGQNKLAPSEDRWALRSMTYPGIADAMANQWNNIKEYTDTPLFGFLF